MEKKHIIFALKLFITGALLGILAAVLSLNPLGISQEQVTSALYYFFLGLGLITVILTFYFIRKSHKAYQSYHEKKRMKKTNKTILLCIVSWIMVR